MLPLQPKFKARPVCRVLRESEAKEDRSASPQPKKRPAQSQPLGKRRRIAAADECVRSAGDSQYSLGISEAGSARAAVCGVGEGSGS